MRVGGGWIVSGEKLIASLARVASSLLRARHTAALASSGVLVALGICLSAALVPARAQDEAMAAQGPPLNIAVFIGSRSDVCYDPGDVAAITKLASLEEKRINAHGGVGGRPLRLRFLDDRRDPQKSIANMREALSDPQMLAMIGLSNSNRAKAVFGELSSQIGSSGIPFLSDISVNGIFKDHANVYSTRPSQEEERVPVMAQFISHLGFARVAFLGLRDVIFSETLGDGLKTSLGAERIVADHRLRQQDDKLDPAAVREAIADLAATSPDMLVLGIGAAKSAEVVRELVAAGVAPALFVTGRIDAIPPDLTSSYPNAMYELAWDRLPEVYNDRLRKLVAQDAPEAWLFEGRKVDKAPGWRNGECEARAINNSRDPLDGDNLRAISIGTQFADMVGLIASAARMAGRGSDVTKRRAQILKELATTFAAGKGAYKGSFQNWSFDPQSRVARRSPLVVILPSGLGRTQLAPVQFIRLRNGGLRQFETLYVDVDLVKAHRIDDNEKTFFAEFYLSMRNSDTASIDRIEFANAYLDPNTNGRQITVEVLHGGGPSDAYPESMKIYKVSGRFLFNPELDRYPFDTQRFSIDLQPKSGDAPFILQPPPLELRDKNVATDGWDPKEQYVGYAEDFVPVIDAYTHAPSIVPFYKGSFVWLMTRQTTDYFLRVVVPLAFILIVAYLSIFIPKSHFEAIVTIQVTALLSAVALYLSLPKLDADTATLSDRIFVFDYMMVSLMIVISILQVNRFVAARAWLKGALGFIHVAVIPLLVAAAAYYVHALSVAEH